MMSSSMLDYNKLVKTKNHHIGTEENPKMAIIGDYWDEDTMTQVVGILKWYQDNFPRTFSKWKELYENLERWRSNYV